MFLWVKTAQNNFCIYTYSASGFVFAQPDKDFVQLNNNFTQPDKNFAQPDKNFNLLNKTSDRFTIVFTL